MCQQFNSVRRHDSRNPPEGGLFLSVSRPPRRSALAETCLPARDIPSSIGRETWHIGLKEKLHEDPCHRRRRLYRQPCRARASSTQATRSTVFDNLSTGSAENLFPEAALRRGRHPRLPAPPRGHAREGYDAVDPPGRLQGRRRIHAQAREVLHSTTSPARSTSSTPPARPASRSIVFSSSAAVYGEPKYLPIDEKHPTEPENYYGFTKLEIERILAWYDKLKGLRFAALRYFNAAGYDAKGRDHAASRGIPPTSSPSSWKWPRACGPSSRSSATTTDTRTAPASATTST